MQKKTVIIFAVSFLGSYLFFQGFFLAIRKNQEHITAEQMHIIQENVIDRFNVYLKVPMNLGLMGGDYFAVGNMLTKDYGPLKKVQEMNREIIGLNLLDAEGRIVRVYPEGENQGAAGKISQNFQALVQSLEKKEPFWFSPPFRLFQGELGFVFYVPIFEHAKLKGWFAPVISTEHFVRNFKRLQFFRAYNLIVKDLSTNQDYFATGLVPEDGRPLYDKKISLHGREMLFQIWPKEKIPYLNFPWYWSFLASLLTSIGIVMFLVVKNQKKKARGQLKDIETLLGLTSKEALHHLIEVQPDRTHPSYLVNLLEQIDLLQTMAHTGEGLSEEQCEIATILENSLVSFKDLLDKKGLTVDDRSSLQGLNVKANGLLLRNTVFSNVLTHCLIHAQQNQTIRVTSSGSDTDCFLTIQVPHLTSGADQVALEQDRRLEVARKALQIYGGELFLNSDLKEGFILRLRIPKL